MSVNYRPDIDGLRALAVVPVVLFHANADLMSGGYIGVDIFFVISGYLITLILMRDLEEESFSLVRFYEKRIRRIFPALFLVFFVSTVVACLLMLPSELDQYGRSLFSATFFYSNYYYMNDAGYFSAPAETQPLLHMWSLAVEEQFYIFFPPLLYLAWRFSKNRVGVIVMVACVLSFLYSLWLVDNRPTDAFFSTPARAWELAVGSLLALYSGRRSWIKTNPYLSNGMTCTGLALLCYGFFTFSASTTFPGASALAPVIGSALIIAAGDARANIVGVILGSQSVRFIGLISYSLYLWHWPILVYYRFLNPQHHLSWTGMAALLGFMVVISILSWRYVETPFRTGAGLSWRRLFQVAGVLMMTSSLFGLAIAKTDGRLVRQYPPEIFDIVSARDDYPSFDRCETRSGDRYEDFRVCTLGEIGQDPEFVVWGDSHAESLLPGIDAAAQSAGLAGVYLGKNGCVPFFGVNQERQGFQDCSQTAIEVLSFLSDHPSAKRIILASRWALYATGERYGNEPGDPVYIRDEQTSSISLAENQRVFRDGMALTLSRLNDMQLSVLLVGQVPETEYNVPLDVARGVLLNQERDLRPRRASYVERQSYVNSVMRDLSQLYSYELLQPHEWMCDAEHCQVMDGGLPLYRDTNHLTERYSSSISSFFEPWLRRSMEHE